MLTFDSFSNINSPIFSDDSGYRIDLIVDIDGIGTNLKFTASYNDIEPYGYELYEAALNGTYGSVSPYVASVERSDPDEITANEIRNKFITFTDKMTVPDYTINDELLSKEQRKELFEVRMQFKRWPKSPGWPEIDLPEIPDFIISEMLKQGYSYPHWPPVRKS